VERKVVQAAAGRREEEVKTLYVTASTARTMRAVERLARRFGTYHEI